MRIDDPGYINVFDIAQRLSYRKRHWFHGPPNIELIGETNSFGKLRFTFRDEIIDQRLYIRDRQRILDAANYAVANFRELTNHLVTINDG